jgi:hypothetical protein
MVERVDVCLDFLQTHVSCNPHMQEVLLTSMQQREYRDAEIYIMRYQQCLTRAMTLIQLYFINTLKNITSEIQKQTNSKVRIRWLDLLIIPHSYATRISRRPLEYTFSIPNSREFLLRLHLLY